MPARLSGSYDWTRARNIGSVPTYVTGAASMACGSCHRADLINDDAALDLAMFNRHTADGGFLVDDSATGANDPTFIYQAIDKIMKMFE